MSVATLPPMKKSPLQGTKSVASSVRSNKTSLLKEVEYKTVLSIIRNLEHKLELNIEVYDMMIEASKRDYKIK